MQASAGALRVTDAELEFIVFLREFKVWLAELSGPARRTLEQLPAETQMLLARSVVNKRMQDSDTSRLWVSGPPQSANKITLVA